MFPKWSSFLSFGKRAPIHAFICSFIHSFTQVLDLGTLLGTEEIVVETIQVPPLTELRILWQQWAVANTAFKIKSQKTTVALKKNKKQSRGETVRKRRQAVFASMLARGDNVSKAEARVSQVLKQRAPRPNELGQVL